jgi:hypothetical protein
LSHSVPMEEMSVIRDNFSAFALAEKKMSGLRVTS